MKAITSNKINKTNNIDKFITEARNYGYILAPRNRDMLNKPEKGVYCKRIIIQKEDDGFTLLPACYTSKNYIDKQTMSDLLELLEQTEKEINCILENGNDKSF